MLEQLAVAKKPKPEPADAGGDKTKPVRLDLSLGDHDRLEKQSRRRGLTKAAYVRQALFERLELDESR